MNSQGASIFHSYQLVMGAYLKNSGEKLQGLHYNFTKIKCKCYKPVIVHPLMQATLRQMLLCMEGSNKVLLLLLNYIISCQSVLDINSIVTLSTYLLPITSVNSCCAEYILWNINIYSYFLQFLSAGMAQVVELLAYCRWSTVCSACTKSWYWGSDNERNQVISIHGMAKISLEYSNFSVTRINSWNQLIKQVNCCTSFNMLFLRVRKCTCVFSRFHSVVLMKNDNNF